MFDLEYKHVRASYLASDLGKTNAGRNVDRLNRVENVLSPRRKVMYQEKSNFRGGWKLHHRLKKKKEKKTTTLNTMN